MSNAAQAAPAANNGVSLAALTCFTQKSQGVRLEEGLICYTDETGVRQYPSFQFDHTGQPYPRLLRLNQELFNAGEQMDAQAAQVAVAWWLGQRITICGYACTPLDLATYETGTIAATVLAFEVLRFKWERESTAA